MSDLLTVAEAAARLGVARQTLARWENEGLIVREAASSRPRFRASAVDALAAARAAAVDPRTAVLTAAARLLREQGVDGCTLDAVAERAAMTRAGVAYHYPTKEDLLTAVARRFLDGFEQQWGAGAEAATPGPGRMWRTYAAATLQHGEEAFASAVLACALGAPDVRDLVKDSLQRFYARLLEEDQEEQLGGRGLLACLAADAVWLFSVLQVMPLNSDERDRALGEVGLAARADGGPR